MADLSVKIMGAATEPYAAVPTINFTLALGESSGATIHAIALKTQIRIEPQRRRYSAAEEERLLEMFGETPQWGESLRPFLWTHVATTVSGFRGDTEVQVPVTCTYDFEVAGAKYMHSLDDGAIPLIFLFSGTVFTKGEAGFAAELVPWHLEAEYQMPTRVWRDTMDLYFPNSGWLRLRRDTMDQLQHFKASRALPTWEQAIEALLKEAGEDVP